jgi:hypothetical protein
MKALQVLLAFWLAAGVAQDSQRATAAATARTDRVVFAVLRRDGVIAPFALLRGRRWTTPWPASLRARELPVDLDAVPNYWWGGAPPERTWRAWLTDGRQETVTLQGPSLYGVHCTRRMGIGTDYRARQPLPPAPTEPFPKDGIAVSGGVQLEPVEIVPRTSEAWPSLAVSLLDDFDRAEDTSIGGVATAAGWRHPVGRAERRKLGVRLESWYRAPLADGGTASYIEAVRSYPPRAEDEGCGLETLFSGWVFQRADGSRPRTSLRAKVTYCDRVGAIYMLPFGVVRVQDGVHWVYQLSGWDDEWYVIAEVGERNARIVAEYYAGGRGNCG